MTTRPLIAAALALAFAWPAAAADAPKAEKRTPKAEVFDFNFDYDLDIPALIADAGVAERNAEAIREHAERMRVWAEDFTREMQGSMAFMFADRVGRGKVVKGAPYSADVITESNQALADGNVISHQSSSRVYRDAEGRTRQETLRGDKVRSIYISDPVAGMSYTLLPGAKLAIAVPRHEAGTPAPRARAPERGKSSSEAPPAPGVDKRVVVRRIPGDDGMPGSEEVRVRVIQIDDDTSPTPHPPLPPMPPLPPGDAIAPIPPLPPIPGVHTMRFESTTRLGKGVDANLGTRAFDGVKAEGKSTTWTIAAGEIGNKKPIQVVSESWYSPELQVTMLSRYNDPRTGESIYRLANVKRAEPAADLFKVPDDYKTRKRAQRETPTPPAAPAPPAAPR